jgi:hypothetical protein
MTTAAAAELEPDLDIRFHLHKRQSLAFLSEANEILYGGAAGGGKSHLIRVDHIRWAVAVPGIQTYIFRRTYPELVDSHLDGPSGFLALLAPWIQAGVVKVNLSDLEIHWPATGSAIRLRHCQHEKDVYRYQSAEMHVLSIDELTHFTKSIYGFLRSRLRLGGLAVPPEYRSMLPRIINGSNPGGVGHNWVKETWIDPAPPMAVHQAKETEGGMRRVFIPARLEDNPTLVENDPTYVDRLAGLASPELVRAMKEGDWDIVAGGALDDVWSLGRHVVPHFAIPRGWSLDRSFDWGSSKPFSVGWWAESNGEPADIGGERRHFPKGTLFRIAELYGWNGRANEGCRKTASEIAREVLSAEKAMGFAGRVQPGPADPAIFAVENGTSIADDMARAGVRWIAAETGPGSRVNGLERVRARLKASLATPMEEPGLFFFDTCRHAIRTLPVLPRDSRKPDDVDTDAEDHLYDETRYRVMRGGPKAGITRRPW